MASILQRPNYIYPSLRLATREDLSGQHSPLNVPRGSRLVAKLWFSEWSWDEPSPSNNNNNANNNQHPSVNNPNNNNSNNNGDNEMHKLNRMGKLNTLFVGNIIYIPGQLFVKPSHSYIPFYYIMIISCRNIVEYPTLHSILIFEYILYMLLHRSQLLFLF